MDESFLSYDEIQKTKYELWREDFNAELSAAPSDSPKAVAEGDSWFDYPFSFDLLDNLKRHHGYKIYKVAEAGDTLENMAYGTETRSNFTRRIPPIEETLRAVSKHNPKFLLLSGGGNDIAGPELASLLNHKDSSLPAIREDYVHYLFFTVFKKAYEHIANRVWRIDESIHVMVHGYGHPVPDGRAVINFPPLGFRFIGPWLRPTMASKNISDGVEAEGIMRRLIDLFNDMLQELDNEHENIHYVDLRNAVQRQDWVNELHLNSHGYKQAADLLHQRMQSLLNE